MRAEGDAAVRHRDVHAVGAGEPADDGLAVGRHRAHAHAIPGDLGVVQPADDQAGAAQQFRRTRPQLRIRRVQVHGHIRRLQVHEPTGMGPQVDLRSVHYPRQAGDGTGLHDEPGGFRTR